MSFGVAGTLRPLKPSEGTVHVPHDGIKINIWAVFVIRLNQIHESL